MSICVNILKVGKDQHVSKVRCNGFIDPVHCKVYFLFCAFHVYFNIYFVCCCCVLGL